MRDLDQYLVGYWPGVLDENGQLHDFSGQGNHGTITGATYTATPRGAGLSFDGTDDEVNCGSDAANMGTGDFTVTTMVKLENKGVLQWLMTKAAGHPADVGNPGFHIVYLYSPPNTQFRLNDGTGSATSTLTSIDLAQNVWIHIAVVVDRDRVAQWYVNGISYESSSISLYQNSMNNVAPFYIGCHWNMGYNMKGQLADLRIYSTALTASEVEALARAPSRTNAHQRTTGDTLMHIPWSDTKLTGCVVQSGSFRPEYDSVLGSRVAACTSTGLLTIPIPLSLQDLTASNIEYEFYIYKGADGNTFNFNFIADRPVAAPTGYRFVFDTDEAMSINEIGVSDLFISAAAYKSIGTWYKITITYTTAGVFTASVDDVQIVEATGNNPATDTTTQSSKCIGINVGTGDKAGPIKISTY